jgi:hypothetical protein
VQEGDPRRTRIAAKTIKVWHVVFIIDGVGELDTNLLSVEKHNARDCSFSYLIEYAVCCGRYLARI